MTRPFWGFLLLAVAFSGSFLCVSWVVGVFSRFGLYGADCLIDNEEIEAFFVGFEFEQIMLKQLEQIETFPIFPTKKATDLGTMPALRTHGSGGLRSGHLTQMHQKGDDARDNQFAGLGIHGHGLEKLVDSRQSILHDKHRRLLPLMVWSWSLSRRIMPEFSEV